MTDVQRQKVIGKVRALRALAESNPSVEESKRAREVADRLVAKYQLTEKEIAPPSRPGIPVETVLACGPSGGTNFEQPLAEGLKVIRHFGSFKKADIILVSDGDATVSEQFLSSAYIPVKKDLDISCYTILLGEDGNRENTNKFSDQTVRLQDALKDEHKMHELFGKV